MKKLLLFICLTPFVVFSQWNQLGSTINGGAKNVALSNDGLTMAIGTPFDDTNGTDSGMVRVYRFIAGNWTQIGQSLYGSGATSYFGGVGYSLPHGQKAIALNATGNIIVIGAHGTNSNAGAASVYEYISGTWVLKGAVLNGTSTERAGVSVDISDDGNVIAVASPFKNTVTGSVKIYEFISGNWVLRGQELTGDTTYIRFGSNVSLNNDGTIIAVGIPLYNSNGANSGKVKVYSYTTGTGRNTNGTWAQIGADLNGEAGGDLFGGTLRLNGSGNTLVVGAPVNAGRGSTYIYQYSGAWNLIGSKIPASANADEFGFSVDINSNGTKIVAGSRVNDGNGNASGQVKVFENIANVWTQVGVDVYGAPTQEFGTSVNINASGTVFAGGAPSFVRVYTTDSALAANDFQLAGNTISLYPNPAKSHFELATTAKLEKVEVYSLQGQLVKTFANQNQYEINDLAKGMYIVKINAQEGIANKTLVIE